MSIAASYLRTKSGGKLKCPSTDKWTNKISTYTRDAYLERNEVLMCDTTWKDLENMVLSEKRQAQKFTYSMIPFI